MKRNKLLGLSATARWRIAGWILLTTVLMVLVLILTARSIFIRQVHTDANAAIVQEAEEFNAFAREALDPQTRRPFTSVTALMETYLERQTPDKGEAFVAVTPTDVLVVDNASKDAGERLAGDRDRLNKMINNEKSSGVEETADGQLRWGKSVVRGSNGEQGVMLYTHFVQNNVDAVHRNMRILFGMMFGGLLLVVSIAWVVAGQILAPIHRFARLSDGIDSFNLSTRLPEDGDNELSRLAKAINKMLDRLSSAHLEQNHVLYEVLEQAQEQAHDLQQVRKQLAEGSPQAVMLDDSLAKMQSLSQNLALLLESGREGFLHDQETRLDSFVEKLAGQLRKQYPEHTWQIAEAADASAFMDTKHIFTAMHHLARNAVAHNAGGEEIQIGASVRRPPEGQSMASFWIVNHGMPLSKEEAKNIFEPLNPAVRRSDLQGPQMGIGLAVVKAIAHAHGGYAWVESSIEYGTVFGIDIPLAHAAAAAEETQVRQAAIEAMQQER